MTTSYQITSKHTAEKKLAVIPNPACTVSRLVFPGMHRPRWRHSPPPDFNKISTMTPPEPSRHRQIAMPFKVQRTRLTTTLRNPPD